MNRPVRFKGRNSYLSNLYACRIRVWGREFHTVESAYQWKKCVHNNDRDTAEKMAATRTGLQAKHLSKNIREKAHLRESWNTQRRQREHVYRFACQTVSGANAGVLVLTQKPSKF